MTDRDLRFIDLDDAAMAPRGLDVGNFVAHLRKQAAIGQRWPPAVIDVAISAFIDGYGTPRDNLECWERLSLAPLAALAETRYGSCEQPQKLLAPLVASLEVGQ